MLGAHVGYGTCLLPQGLAWTRLQNFSHLLASTRLSLLAVPSFGFLGGKVLKLSFHQQMSCVVADTICAERLTTAETSAVH